MKLAISGSRSLKDDRLVRLVLDAVCAEYGLEPTQVFSGGAEGFDVIAEDFFNRSFGILPNTIRPDYKAYPEEMKWKAPLDRNTKLVEKADVLLAVWSGVEVNGRKGGTRDTRDKALGRKLPTIFVDMKQRSITPYNNDQWKPKIF